jgi:hypothetical protein
LTICALIYDFREVRLEPDLPQRDCISPGVSDDVQTSWFIGLSIEKIEDLKRPHFYILTTEISPEILTIDYVIMSLVTV